MKTNEGLPGFLDRALHFRFARVGNWQIGSPADVYSKARGELAQMYSLQSRDEEIGEKIL